MLLSPEKFEWEKYCGRVGWATSQLMEPQTPMEYEEKVIRLKPDVNYIGHCDAGRIPVRPRPGENAIMVEIDGEETWFHSEALPKHA